jgi:hypothetical protein
LNFEDTLAKIKLSQIVKNDALKYMVGNYETFIKDLAKKYHKQSSIKEFPFAIKTMKQGLVEFENP